MVKAAEDVVRNDAGAMLIRPAIGGIVIQADVAPTFYPVHSENSIWPISKGLRIAG
jgi:hypothetical protein